MERPDGQRATGRPRPGSCLGGSDVSRTCISYHRPAAPGPPAVGSPVARRVTARPSRMWGIDRGGRARVGSSAPGQERPEPGGADTEPVRAHTVLGCLLDVQLERTAVGSGANWYAESILAVLNTPQRDRFESGNIVHAEQIRPARAGTRTVSGDPISGEPACASHRVYRVHPIGTRQHLRFASIPDRHHLAVAAGVGREDGHALDRVSSRALLRIHNHHHLGRSCSSERPLRLRQALVHHPGRPDGIGGGRMPVVRQPLQPVPVGPTLIADHADDQQLARRVQHGQLADNRAEQSTQLAHIPVDYHFGSPS